MATIEDWTDIGTGAASGHGTHSRCILELRARVEALEAQAACEPAQAEQGQGAEPLWRRMYSAYLGVRIDANFDDISGELDDWADVMNAVADWLQSGRGDSWAAQALRAEAQATREGCRG